MGQAYPQQNAGGYGGGYGGGPGPNVHNGHPGPHMGQVRDQRGCSRGAVQVVPGEGGKGVDCAGCVVAGEVGRVVVLGDGACLLYWERASLYWKGAALYWEGGSLY
eukprot:1513410-Rhodomonas_salina.1